MDMEKIKEQAKKIMDSFAGALEKVEVEEAKVEREQDRRQEKEGKEADFEFRNIMFENAPKTKNNCIEAEKGSWVE